MQREKVERKETRGERGGTPRERQPNRRGKDPRRYMAYIGGATQRRKLPMSSRCWAVDTKPGNNKRESTGGSTPREEEMHSPNGEIEPPASWSQHAAPLLGGRHIKKRKNKGENTGGPSSHGRI
jgi:hypothetical protein